LSQPSEDGNVLTLSDMIARIQRLDELTRGLAKEVLLWREANDPLLYLERRAYLNAIQDALAGVESARVVLARARQRIESTREAAGSIEPDLPRPPSG
jgi:hypothetical protein